MIIPDYTGQTIDHYLLERLIGSGNLGSVYAARRLSDRQIFAVKLIDARFALNDEFRKHFFQQMQIVRQLRHPHLAGVLDYKLLDERLYLVLPLLTGGTLTRWLDQYRQQQHYPPLPQVFEIIHQIGQALDYIHDHGVVHRNLKPDNILFETEPDQKAVSLKLMDTGVGQMLYTLADRVPGLPGQTLAYIAPEQALNASDPQIDIYALGVIFYELLTGKPPHQPASLMEVTSLVLNPGSAPPGPHQLRPELPAALDAIVAKALAPSPGDRFLRGQDLSRALREIQAGSLIAATPVQISPPGKPAPGVPPPPRVATGTPLPDPPPDLTRREILDVIQSRRPKQSLLMVRDSYLIGREPDCDLPIEHRLLSRHHARIERDGRGNFQITDLGTTNGTWLDNVRLLPGEPALWRPPAMVRLGDVWLSIRVESDLEDTVPLVEGAQDGDAPAIPRPINGRGYNGVGYGGGTPPPDAVSPDYEPPVIASPGYRPPVDPGLNQLDAVLIPRTITVNPGGAGNLILEVINHTPQADHVMIQSLDMSAAWLTLPAYSVHLPPASSESLSLLVHPPNSAESTVGPHPLTLQVTGMNSAGKIVVVRGEVVVTPFRAFSISLHPLHVRSGHPGSVIIYNDGNSEIGCTVTIRSPDERLRIDPYTTTVRLPPGRNTRVSFWLTLPDIEPVQVPFEVTVESTDGTLWQQLFGMVMPSRPAGHSGWQTLLRLAALLIFPGLLLLCGLLAVGYVSLENARLDRIRTTATAIAIAATATRDAFSLLDVDGDSLSTEEELVRGTDPLLADTDFDGLTDAADPEPLNPRTIPHDPVQFVQDYYQRVNNREYDFTFTWLTPGFLVSTGTTSLDAYRAWWDSVQQVVIGEVYLLTADEQTACVYAELLYNMVDGRQIADNQTQVILVRDQATGHWLIDAKRSH